MAQNIRIQAHVSRSYVKVTEISICTAYTNHKMLNKLEGDTIARFFYPVEQSITIGWRKIASNKNNIDLNRISRSIITP